MGDKGAKDCMFAIWGLCLWCLLMISTIRPFDVIRYWRWHYIPLIWKILLSYSSVSVMFYVVRIFLFDWEAWAITFTQHIFRKELLCRDGRLSLIRSVTIYTSPYWVLFCVLLSIRFVLWVLSILATFFPCRQHLLLVTIVFVRYIWLCVLLYAILSSTTVPHRLLLSRSI